MFWFLACHHEPVNEEALLRAGKLSEALAAYEARGGRLVPAEHPTAQTLASRAEREPWITVPVLVDLTEAAALLDATPQTRLQDIQVSFERWLPMATCTTAELQVPWRIAVGRSTVAADPDPLEHGKPFRNIPYSRGRVVGTASALRPEFEAVGRAEASALFASMDKNPPARRVTLVLSEGRDTFALNLERRDGVWWSVSATDAAAAAVWATRCTNDP